MCKKKKKDQVVLSDSAEQQAVAQPEKTESIAPEEKDYFAEYYKTYKNNYIDEYLRAYHRYKETGEIDDTLRELQGYDMDDM